MFNGQDVDDTVVVLDLWYVMAYSIDFVYGGPENGGWYYPSGSRIIDPKFYSNLGVLPSVHLAREEANKAEDVMNTALAALGLGFEYEAQAYFPEVRPTCETPLCGKPASFLRVDKPGREYTPVCTGCRKAREQSEMESDDIEEYTEFIPLSD